MGSRPVHVLFIACGLFAALVLFFIAYRSDSGDSGELDNAEAYFERGYDKYVRGDMDGAIADYDEALRLNPDYADAYASRGDARKAKVNLDGAIADYDEALRLAPDKARRYGIRGGLKVRNGDLDGAAADFDEALHLAPDDEWIYYSYERSYYWLGKDKADRGDLEGAIASFDEALRRKQEALRLAPGDGKAYAVIYSVVHHNRGITKKENGDLDGAIADYDEALRLEPFSKAYNDRGLAREAKGDLDGALADYDEALRLKTGGLVSYAVTLINYGVVKITIRLQEVLRLVPDDAEVYSNRGTAGAGKHR